MNSGASTPRMPNSMSSTLPYAPFDTLKNCTTRSSSPVGADAACATAANQADPAKEPNAWFNNNLNAPSDLDSDSMFGNTFNAASAMGQHSMGNNIIHAPAGIESGSAVDQGMHAPPGMMDEYAFSKSLHTGMQAEYILSADNRSGSMMSPRHDSGSLTSPPKADSPIAETTALLPTNTAALQDAYQSSFIDGPSKPLGVQLGRGQMAGWGRGGRVGGTGAADQSGYSAQLSTLDQRLSLIHI